MCSLPTLEAARLMKKQPPLDDSAQDFLAEAAAPEQSRYILRLYITGYTPLANKAIVRIRKICEEHLQGRYELEVVDIAKNPALAAGEQIIAAPTLIKKLPLPLRRFIGDMSQTERILLGLDLLEAGEKPPRQS